MAERRRYLLVLACLTPVVLLCYAGLFDSWFLRDDFMWLSDARAQLGEPLRFLTTRPSGYFRPVASLFFGLEHLAFGTSATGYLVVNVLLHLGNAALLGALLLALGAPLRLAAVAATTAALLVTAAPGVVWISDIVSLLALGFVLLAALAHRRYLLDGRLRDQLLALLAVALAAGSRESGVLAGAGIVLLELHHGGPRALARAAAWRRLLPFLLLGAAYLWVQADFLGQTLGGRGAAGGGLLAFLTSWLANLPALVVWTSGERVSLELGALLLAGLVVGLGLLGGRSGLVAAAWLVGLLLLALLPAAAQLTSGPTIAARYRYEAVFVAATAVATLFAFAWPAVFRWRGPRLVVGGLAALGLALLLGGHARATAAFVDQDLRYAVAAEQTRAFDAELARVLAGAPRVLVLAGAPVENPRHLRDQLEVLHGWSAGDLDRLRSFAVDLRSPVVRGRLQREPGPLLAQLAELEPAGEGLTAQVLVWDRQRQQLVPAAEASAVYGKLRYDWRRPGRVPGSARSALVQVLPIPVDAPPEVQAP
jgi:hypothetical protein